MQNTSEVFWEKNNDNWVQLESFRFPVVPRKQPHIFQNRGEKAFQHFVEAHVSVRRLGTSMCMGQIVGKKKKNRKKKQKTASG